MKKIVPVVVGCTTLLALWPALAQDDGVVALDPALFEQGQVIYDANCVACHQPGGVGLEPSFPALNANDILTDLNFVIGNIAQGRGAMPAFPDLTATDIAAVLSFIRNAWDNDFGGVTPEMVEEVLAGLEERAELTSVWEVGMFTTAQAERGENLYEGWCAECHGARLNGAPEDPDRRSSPALAGGSFLNKWQGTSVATLFEYMRATMPESNPGFLPDQDYADILAYMFFENDMPAGDNELPPDTEALAAYVITLKPAE
ncbi:MAG: cytochrome c [Bauldia sp.]|nr:cytochrome c [Bauldia sp.]